MFSEKSISVGFVVVCLILIWTTFKINVNSVKLHDLSKINQQQKKELDSLERKIFDLQVELFKYERALEIIKFQDSISGSHYSDIILDETE